MIAFGALVGVPFQLPRLAFAGSTTAPPRPSVQTQFVLSAMEDASRAEQLRWERVNDKFDLLFSQVDDILGTQIKLEAQYNMTNKVVEQMLRDQEILAKQIENTGQAVAH